MQLFNRDIFVSRHIIKTVLPRPLLRLERGHQDGDWELTLGPWYVVVSLLKGRAKHADESTEKSF